MFGSRIEADKCSGEGRYVLRCVTGYANFRRIQAQIEFNNGLLKHGMFPLRRLLRGWELEVVDGLTNNRSIVENKMAGLEVTVKGVLFGGQGLLVAREIPEDSKSAIINAEKVRRIGREKNLRWYLKELLGVGELLGEMTSSALDDIGLPVRSHAYDTGILYHTILTKPEGIVWLERVGLGDRLPSSPMLVRFPNISRSGLSSNRRQVF